MHPRFKLNEGGHFCRSLTFIFLALVLVLPSFQRAALAAENRFDCVLDEVEDVYDEFQSSNIIKQLKSGRAPFPLVRLTFPRALGENKRLELKMLDIIRWDPYLSRPRNEAYYYSMMEAYSSFIPEYNSREELEEAGLIRLENNRYVSDYAMSHTHLGVLTVERRRNGTFRIAANRGTDYFRAPRSPQFRSGFLDNSLNHIRSREARETFRRRNIVVNVAVPRSELERFGIRVETIDTDDYGEVVIHPDLLAQMRGVLLFRTTVQSPYDK